MTSLKDRILTELSFTNLGTARLAAILNVKVSELKEILHRLVEDKKVRQIEVKDEKVWEVIE